jgi:hypothetical protein
MWRILSPTKSGILTRFIFGIELFAVGIAAISILSMSAKYLRSETTNAEKKFQKLKYRHPGRVHRHLVSAAEQLLFLGKALSLLVP